MLVRQRSIKSDLLTRAPEPENKNFVQPNLQQADEISGRGRSRAS